MATYYTFLLTNRQTDDILATVRAPLAASDKISATVH